MTDPALTEVFPLDPGLIDEFQRLGHVAVRGLASTTDVARYKSAIDEATMARRFDRRPLEERDTYGRAFIQSANVHQHDPLVAEFVLARRFARVAAQLLGCRGVRLYHDQALYKEPGGGHTPWHQDQVYWPLDTDRTVTMWMPLVDVSDDIGGMTFADESWRDGNLGDLTIGDESHAHFQSVVAKYRLSTYGPFRAGDATFHRGWTLHSAPANRTAVMRSVITVIYFADGACVSDPVTSSQNFDHLLWLGGKTPGTAADGDTNPLLWHESWS
jgi:ectoine hydroxylase-related dioxygenase (phytanoyl-CoA dioxygenase family)